MPSDQSTPFGFCKCGCGQPAPIAKKTNKSRGQTKGHPVSYILGHRRPVEWIAAGQQRSREYSMDVKSRFFAKVDLSAMGGCWDWTGARDRRGYGVVVVEQKRCFAHRVSWELWHGPVGALCVLHKCDRPCCVNPSHLFVGTQADNMRDMQAKGRARGGSLKGDDNPMSAVNIAKRRSMSA